MNQSNSELRDIFAIVSMHALLLEDGFKADVCKRAYEIADLMMEERDR